MSRRSNCLFWALPRWLKNYLAGEALVIRRSTFTWVPHFMRAPCISGLQIEEFTPQQYPDSTLKRAVPVQAIVFKGKVRAGDAECWCLTCRAACADFLHGRVSRRSSARHGGISHSRQVLQLFARQSAQPGTDGDVLEPHPQIRVGQKRGSPQPALGPDLG